MSNYEADEAQEWRRVARDQYDPEWDYDRAYEERMDYLDSLIQRREEQQG